MQSEAIASCLLILAIALSLPRTLVMFRPATTMVAATSPVTMVATAVCVSGSGFAFSGTAMWLGSIIVVAGLLLGLGVRSLAPAMAVLLSACCLSAYLEIMWS